MICLSTRPLASVNNQLRWDYPDVMDQHASPWATILLSEATPTYSQLTKDCINQDVDYFLTNFINIKNFLYLFLFFDKFHQHQKFPLLIFIFWQISSTSKISFTYFYFLTNFINIKNFLYLFLFFDKFHQHQKFPLLIFIFWQISSTSKISFTYFYFLTNFINIKNFLYLFLFFDKFHQHFAMRWSYAQKPLFPFWRKSIVNIRWMLSWALVAIIILCVR